MEIHCYSPRPQAEYSSAFANVYKFQHESWNLLFLVVNMDRQNPYRGASGLCSAIWRTVCCDIRTGESVNPFGRSGIPLVADLLRGSPHHFYAWAVNNPAFERLPITAVRPDWLKVAKRRLSHCAPHPDDVHFVADAVVKDLRPAQLLLKKYCNMKKKGTA